jgi:hypothetical protein
MHIITCGVCEKQFTNARQNRKFCSQACYHIDRERNGDFRKKLMGGKCCDCEIEILKSRKRCVECNLKFRARAVKPQKMNVKTHCSKCGVEKTHDNTFSPREGMWSPQCRECLHKKGRRSQEKLKQECVDYKGGQCNICGYKKCLSALDFHHVDPNEKDFTVARKKLNINNEKMRAELDKCVLLCANCHREEHSRLTSGAPSLLAHASEELDWLGINSV